MSFSFSVSANKYCILTSLRNLIIVFFITDDAGQVSCIQSLSPGPRRGPSSEVEYEEEAVVFWRWRGIRPW